MVAITRDAANSLGLPYKTERWPRSLHAQLIDGLRRAGADTIVFDLLFRQAQGEADALLADAMRRAGNVLLLEFLDKSVRKLESVPKKLGIPLLVAVPRIDHPKDVYKRRFNDGLSIAAAIICMALMALFAAVSVLGMPGPMEMVKKILT